MTSARRQKANVMGIARIYNRFLFDQLRCHAAWLPLGTRYELGDFGLISGGVFQRMGNITKDFDVEVREGQPPQPVALSFASQGTRTVRVAAGARVDVFPEGPIDGKLEVHFDGAESLLVKAKEVRVTQMDNVEAAAVALKRRRGWRWRFRIVRQVWSAQNAVVVSSVAKDTVVTFSAKVEALKRLELGDASLDMAMGSTKQLGLDLVGASGPLGLGLFRVRSLGAAGAKLLGGDEGDDDPVEVDSSATWPEALEDDL